MDHIAAREASQDERGTRINPSNLGVAIVRASASRILVLLNCLFLAACAPNATPLENDIHTIVLLECDDPHYPRGDPPDLAFSLGGGGGGKAPIVGELAAYVVAIPILMIYAGVRTAIWEASTDSADVKEAIREVSPDSPHFKRVEQLRILLDRQNLQLGRGLTDAIEAELKARNYAVIRRARPAGFMERRDYTLVGADADAILDIAITFVGFDSGVDRDHQPVVIVSGQLIEAPRNARLRRIHAVYDPRFAVSGPQMPSDDGAEHIFASLNDMLARPDAVGHALKASERPLAERVAGSLD